MQLLLKRVFIAIISLCSLLAFSTTAYAGNSPASRQLQGILASLKSMKANYTQKVYAKGRLKQSAVGIMALKRPGKFRWHINPYLTDTSDWYVVVEHPVWKPFVYRAPKSIRQIIADFNNSDRAREFNELALHADIRNRLGVWMPATIIKVNN